MRSPLAEARNDSGAAPREGELVGGRYRVEGVIGTGGMGRVVAARDEAGRPVAIKLLLSPPSERVWVERFFREARTVSRINSQHVVKVLAVSSANEETPFIVMERLRGRDFGKRLRAEGPLTLRDVADCIVQACDALACSHNVGVVHRDVKPSNLFDHANPDGSHTLKVLDFGISKARGQEEFEHTLTTSRDGMLGSPPYMSPEHIRDARSVDHRTDIWSLGVVAYQLLAGRLPFDGQSVGEVFCSVLERRFSPLSKVRPDLPREIESIINKCLSREPSERYQNAAELAKAFAPHASPRANALVGRMPTSVTALVSSQPAPSRETPIPGHGKRLDAELHTITLPPVGTGEVPVAAVDADAEAAPTEPTIVPIMDSIDPVISIPKLLPHYDDLSAASIEAAKRMRRPKRSVALAAGVAVLMFALMAIPFLISNTAKVNAAPSAVAPVPAPAAPAAADIGQKAAGATPAPPVPSTPTKTSAQREREIVSLDPPTPAVHERRSPLTPPRDTRSGRAPSRAKSAPAPKPAPEPVKAEKPEAPPPPKPAPKPEAPRELHPNPYDQ